MSDKEMIPISPISAGYDTHNIDYSTQWELSSDSFNCATGQSTGIGPRYGMATFPTQGFGQDIYSTIRMFDGLKILGIIELKLKNSDDTAKNVDSFLFISSASTITNIASPDPNINYPDRLGHDMMTISNVNFNYSEDIRGRLQNLNSVGFGPSQRRQIYRRSGYDPQGAWLKIRENFLIQKNKADYQKTSIFKSPKKSYSHQTIVGETRGTPTNTDPKDMLLFPFGASTYLNLKQYSAEQPRDIEVKICKENLQRKYIYKDLIPDENIYKPALQDTNVATNLDLSSYTPTTEPPLVGTGGNYNFPLNTILIDPLHKVETSFTMLTTISGSNIYATIMQEYVNDSFNRRMQYIDLKNPFPAPMPKDTKNNYANNGSYTENSIIKQTCFHEWPSFENFSVLVTKGQSSPDDQEFTIHTFGPNTGVLRTNRTYEITYSIFDKSIGHESNVGLPAKFDVDEDNTAIVLRRIVADTVSGKSRQVCPILGPGRYPIDPKDPVIQQFANDCQFRFYYREIGTFEWLPALFVDVSDYIANPDPQYMLGCTGQEFGVVGGQPGGINDYSPLPDEEYVDTVVYRSRLFVLSTDALRWSNSNDPISFPLRNTVPSSSDSFIGMVVHNYPGQADQRARLIVFGSNQIYVGSFTGRKQQQQVQIDSELAVFEVDGSDFVLEPWTRDTAFSSRSFVIADGFLYYWGPTGVFFDDGVNTPKKLSANIEPEISDLIDNSKKDEIFCVYNSLTQEVIFFYTPKDTSTYKKHALVFNRKTGGFYAWRSKANIVWAQNFDINQEFEWAGERVVVGVKNNENSKIAPYFMDQKCQGGDYTSELFAQAEGFQKGLSHPVISIKDYTSSITAGSILSVTGLSQYYPGESLPDNLKIQIIQTNSGYPSITGTFVSDFEFPNSIFANGRNSQSPLFIEGINNIDWSIENTYFCPGGIFQEWIFHYLHFLIRIKTLETVLERIFLLTHSTPTGEENTFTIDIDNNSKGHCQRYAMLEEGINSNRGQGLKLKLSGSDIFTGWVIQYLSAYANKIGDEFLQEFE